MITKKITLILTLALLFLTSCQTPKPIPIPHEKPDPNLYIGDAGRIVKIEPFESELIKYPGPASVVETTKGLFTIKGNVPTFKKFYPVQKQGDYIYFKNSESIIKKYELW
jgi:hypothetical protein